MKTKPLNLDQLREHLAGKYTARQLSIAANITTAGAYSILAGAATPSPKTLMRIGIRTETLYYLEATK